MRFLRNAIWRIVVILFGMGTATSSAWAQGACCFFDGTCTQVQVGSQCLDLGGAYGGDGSACAEISCSGACCLPNGSCEIRSSLDCLQAAGVYQGGDIDCYNGRCGRFQGACCFDDGTCQELLDGDECLSMGGFWLGFDAACVPCFGACCFEDGSCLEAQSNEGCESAGGQYLGHGTDCLVRDCQLERYTTSFIGVPPLALVTLPQFLYQFLC